MHFCVVVLASLPPAYVGSAACVSCHAQEGAAWSRSHHALSMQPASAGTVLGELAGLDGGLQPAYTFGVAPLQQYLVETGGGRLQPFGTAWDSRPASEGGQRWFELSADDWNSRGHNWNDVCADCHSTRVKKGYSLATDTYATTWSELNVACEACHGPGSQHVSSAGHGGLTVALGPRGTWAPRRRGDATLRRTNRTRDDAELDTCAPCHARRHAIAAEPQPGERFLDAYAPALLDEGVYFADGQFLDEDYEYGSFLQSKMHREGVTCSSCHEPHSLGLRSATANGVCAQCHRSERFDTTAHHHHADGSAGAQCVSCHMPSRTYMQVDARRDHSLRVPRPDRTVAFGVPNACTQCHADQPPEWAAAAVARWYGPHRRREPGFVEAVARAQSGKPGAEAGLTRLVLDRRQPGMARATAASLLPASSPALRGAARDDDPLVRRAAVLGLAALDAEARARVLGPRLSDSVRAVRIEAARALADVAPGLLNERQVAAREAATKELIASEQLFADRPESHRNLALLFERQGRAGDARAELETALRLDPSDVPALVNLADLHRATGRDDLARPLLEQAVAHAADAAAPRFALGLLAFRQHRTGEALALLARAAELEPRGDGYAYTYAVALHDLGDLDRSIKVLRETRRLRPDDRDVVTALAAFEHAKELARLGNPR
jgi:tetratricopeptide (TPR) repeat protein